MSDSAMHCEKCGFANPTGMRFCGQCAAPLQHVCHACGFANPPDFRFCGQCAAALESSTSTVSTTHTIIEDDDLQVTPEAERRQLTVLFCDLVGSSSLSERIDPEELRDIMREYRTTCAEIIERYDGFIAQYLGDGILAYFGYPQAHEDDAQRATRAALEIVNTVPTISMQDGQARGTHLEVRAGVHTGLVVVGEMGGGDKRTLALGDTPNIAARIQNFAGPNTVVISQVTHRLLDKDFDCESQGQHQLKGFTQAMELFTVRRLHPRRRFRGHDTLHTSAILGREQESALLMERLDEARKGVAQIIMLSGEAGMGKTRMAQMVCDQASRAPCVMLEMAGSPYYQHSFLFPVISLLRRQFRLRGKADGAFNLARLEQAMTQLEIARDISVPILAELLSIPLDEHYAVQPDSLVTTPQQKKQQTLELLMQILQTLTYQHFVLLIVEDLHWIDPSTMELLTQLANKPGLSNLYALFTFRDEFSPPWATRKNITHIALNRLTRTQAGQMVRELCQHKELPRDVFTSIVDKTDGIPFFIEEITSTLLTSAYLMETGDHFELNTSLAQLGIPSSLQDSLMSRLDRLGEEKELAQLSSILGREFEHELLSYVSTRDEKSLQTGLDRLINAELFNQRGQRPKAFYSFRHALLRDAAYQSLLKRTRQKYHARIAKLLITHFPNTLEENPELLAHHCTEAGDIHSALQYWLAAGKHAIAHSANIEAIAHLKKGLELLAALPDSVELRSLELAFQTSLGLAVMMNKGYGAAEVEQAYARAKQLCHDITDMRIIFPVLCGLWEYYVVRANLKTAHTLATELHELADAAGEKGLILEAQRAMGTTQLWRGQLETAREYLRMENCPRDLSTIVQSRTTSPHGHDSRVAILANTACVQWLSGQPDTALELATRGLQLARQLAHPFSQAYALNFVCTLTQLRGERQLVADYAEKQISLCENYGFPFWSAMGRMFQAWSNAAQLPVGTCLSRFESAFKDYESSGNRIARSYFLALFINMLLEAGQQALAMETVNNALQEIESSGERFFQAELLRLKGQLMMQQATINQDAAETVLSQALHLSIGQSAHSLSLRVALDLGQLWIRLGKESQAAELVTGHLKNIKGGESTLDSIKARQLLATCGYTTRS